MLMDGVNAMLKIAAKILAKPSQAAKDFNLIQDAEQEGGDDQELPGEAVAKLDPVKFGLLFCVGFAWLRGWLYAGC
jgi:hypothetical protein